MNRSIVDLVFNTVLSFKYPAKEKQITIATQIDPNIQVYGDAKLLASVVSVLLDNAVKYTPSEGSITVLLEEEKPKSNLV